MQEGTDAENRKEQRIPGRRVAHTIYVYLDNGLIEEVPAVIGIRVTGAHVVLERENGEPTLIPRDTVFYAGDMIGVPPWT